MIRSVLVLKPKLGREVDVVDLFKREGVFDRALTVDGCRDVSMLVSDGEILVTASWIDAAAYQGWVDHPQRNSTSDELNELLDAPMTPETTGGLYEVALEAVAEQAGR